MSELYRMDLILSLLKRQYYLPKRNVSWQFYTEACTAAAMRGIAKLWVQILKWLLLPLTKKKQHN